MNEVKHESNLTICRKCMEKKLRVFVGKYPSGNKRYKDEFGNLWSGNICPSCNKNRIKEAMRVKRGLT